MFAGRDDVSRMAPARAIFSSMPFVLSFLATRSVLDMDAVAVAVVVVNGLLLVYANRSTDAYIFVC